MDLMSLVARLTLDKSQYDQGLNDASAGAKSFGEKLKGGLGTAAKVGGVALAAVGTAAAAATTALVKQAGEVAAYGDNIDKASQKLGISAEAYQEWDAVLQHSGTSIDSMGVGMKTLASKAASGSDAFRKLGISAQKAAKMSREDLFAETITALQNITDENARAQLAQELFGRSAMELGPLLNTSAKDTEAMKQRVHELGGVMSNEAVKASAKYQDSLQDMKTMLEGAKTSLFTAFLPVITDAMDAITAMAPKLQQAIEWARDVIADVIPVLKKTFGYIVEKIGPKLKEFGEKAVDLFGSIGTAVTNFMDGPGGTLVSWLVDTVATGWEFVVTEMEAFMDFLTGVFTGDWEKAWNALCEMVAAPFNALGEILKTPINAVIDLVNGMLDAVEAAINKVINAVNSVIDKMPAMDLSEYGMPGMYKMPKIGSVSWDHIAHLANGGYLTSGQTAVVGEYEPEVLRMIGNRAVVTPTGVRRPGGQEYEVPRAGTSQPVMLDIRLFIKETEIGRALVPYIDAEHQRYGVSLAGVMG